MPFDDEPVAAPPAESLQFDHAEFAAAPVASVLACAACQRPIAGACYEVNGRTLCGSCRERIAAHFLGGSAVARFLRATVLGGLAAAAGTLLYFLVLALTGYQVGLIAILVGFMVGAAVRKGARYRGGLAYQLLAVFLTYTSIVTSYLPLIVAEIVKQGKAEPAVVAGAETTPAKAQPKAESAKPEAAPAKAESAKPEAAPRVAQLFLAVVILVGVAYASPFLAGAQNLLGLAIIFFGLLQAWRMNRRVPLAINGPFQVGGSGGPPPQELPAHA